MKTLWLILKATVLVPLVLLFLAFLLFCSSNTGAVDRGWILFTLGLAGLCLKVNIIIHEAGHLLFGRLSGGIPFQMVLGKGRELVHVKIGGVRCSLHEHFRGGMAYVGYRSMDKIRWRYAVLVAGGAATNVLLALVVAMLEGHLWPPLVTWDGVDIGISIPAVFMYTSYVVAIGALIPYSSHYWNGKPKPTDGKRLLQLFSIKQEELRELLLLPIIVEAQKLLADRNYDEARDLLQRSIPVYPNSIHLKLWLGLVYNKQMRVQEAVALMQDVESRQDFPDRTPVEKAQVYNLLAWLYLLLEGEEALDLADDYSLKAYELSPDSNEIRDTRGTVLMERGAVDEALALFTTLVDFRKPDHIPLNAALQMSYGWFLKGDMEQRDRYWALVEKRRDEYRDDERVLYDRIRTRMGMEEAAVAE